VEESHEETLAGDLDWEAREELALWMHFHSVEGQVSHSHLALRTLSAPFQNARLEARNQQDLLVLEFTADL